MAARVLLAAALACGALALAGQPAWAAFPGANGVIAFSTDLSGNFEDWTIDPDGTNEQRLTHCPTEDSSLGCFNPAWSADGRRLASTRMQRFSGVLSTDIVVMNADGSDFHPIFTELAGIVYAPAWSPDGTRIAFVRDVSAGAEIWTMGSDGSNPAPVTSALAGSSSDPVWSPDGSTIAYGHKGDVYAMDPDGSDQRSLTQHPAGDFHPDWSPDGTRIVFGSNRTAGPGRSSVWSMNADGSDQVELTGGPGQIDYMPGYSPDGQQIAFMSNRSGEEEVWAMNADGSQPRRLTFNADAFDAQADWQSLPTLAPLPPPPTPPASPASPPVPGGARSTPVARAEVALGRVAWMRRGSRRVGVPIACDGARCAGTLTLRAPRRALGRGRRGTAVIGRASFSLRPDDLARVRVQLSRSALRALRGRGRLRVQVLAGGRSSTLVLRMPRAPRRG